MTVWEKIADFFANCTSTDWLILGAIVLLPVIVIALVVVAFVNGKKHRNDSDAPAVEETPILKVAPAVEEAPAKPAKRKAEPAPEPVEEPKKEHKIRYVTTKLPGEQVRVKVRVKNLCKVDQSLLVATGMFGVSLGIAIQRAFDRGR